MCLESPARVVAVDADGRSATVDMYRGTGRTLLLTLDAGDEPVAPGDWLLVHSGLAVARLDPGEAHELLELIAEARSMGEGI